MKILFLHDRKLPFYGGEKILLENKMLLEREGHDVRIYYGAEKTSSPLNYLNFYSLKHKRKISKILDEFRPDVVYCHETIQITESAFKTIKKRGIRLVKILQSYKFYCPKSMGIFQDGRECRKGINKLCSVYRCKAQLKGILSVPYYFIKTLRTYFSNYNYKKYVDAFICPTRKQMVMLKKLMDIPQAKMHCVPNIIKTGPVKAVESRLIKPAQFTYVGRVSVEKGIETAVKAIERLVKREGLKDIMFKVIGDGPQLDEIRAMVKELGLSENIDFLGRVRNDELNSHYQESVAIIVPSAWLEVGPLVILEAMKNASPVIATSICGASEYIEHGVSGWKFEMDDFVALSDYMKKLYNNPRLSDYMGRAGYERFRQEFSEEAYGGKLIAVLTGS